MYCFWSTNSKTDLLERICLFFHRDNFLKVDIYYPTLSKEIIEQNPAFEWASLLGEVGGFMGLLLGASVLTLCELLDYLLVKCIAHSKRKKTNVIAVRPKEHEQHTGPSTTSLNNMTEPNETV